MVKHLTKDDFKDFIKEGVAVIDFYADWCGPCQMVKPIFEELSSEMKDVKFGSVDTQAQEELASEYGIRSIPAFILFKDGEQVADRVGGATKDGIKKWIEEST
tara:strand:+ start:3439 stop:3747 length:309 start_codon:yes stop_codon:yes gene_type:complete